MPYDNDPFKNQTSLIDDAKNSVVQGLQAWLIVCGVLLVLALIVAGVAAAVG